MRPRRCEPDLCTRRRGSRAPPVPNRSLWSTIASVSPMMALSGVRSSWLMIARNRDL